MSGQWDIPELGLLHKNRLLLGGGEGEEGEVRGGVGLHDLKDSAFMFSVFILDADETQIL